MEKQDDYVEYVPVAKRRAMEAHKILQRKIKSSGLEEKSDKLKLAVQANPSLLVKAQSEKSNFVAKDKPSRPSLLVKSLEMNIPQLVWFKVLLVVAKHSSEDLYSMAGTCKLFQQMLNDPEVWTTVSVDKYQWHEDWYGFDEGKIIEFLQKCKEHNNPEIIYRKAIHDFFLLKDDEVLKNLRVAAMAGHKEASYLVGLLGLLNPSEGKENAMEFLCHLSKMKKLNRQACRDSIRNRLLRYTMCGTVTPLMLAKFTADERFFQDCIHCKGNREWFQLWHRRGENWHNVDAWNCCEPCKWKRELFCFQLELQLMTAWI
ncbi:hypothetical protein CerSpe_070020 [Prunus speciosa]